MSPIKGLTDRHKSAFPELGIIRKGGAKPSDSKPGQDLRHFRFTSDRPEVVAAFEKTYGATPNKVEVYLPYPTVGDNFDCWKEQWTQSQLVHRCDGETCVLWWDPKAQGYQTTPKPCPGGCKQVGRLKVLIMPLVAAGHIGLVTVLTTSKHDIMSIQASLEQAEASSPRGLSGVPMIMWREPKKISTPNDKGGRSRREKWLVRIAPSSQWVQRMLAAAEHQAYAMLEGPKDGGNGAREAVDTESGEILSVSPEPAPAARPAARSARPSVPERYAPPPPDDEDEAEEGEFAEPEGLFEPEEAGAAAPVLPTSPEPEAATEPSEEEKLARARREQILKLVRAKAEKLPVAWSEEAFDKRFTATYKVSLAEAPLAALDDAWEKLHKK